MGDIADDIIDDMIGWVDPYNDYLDQIDAINRRWASGRHMLKDGKCIKIKDMETSHIQNCINLWSKNKEYDLTSFTKELKKRLKTNR